MRRYDYDGDNDPRYDEDGDLTFEHTSMRLLVMLEAWPNRSKDFPDNEEGRAAAKRWLRMLVEFVLEQEPSAAELEAMCRKLINGNGAKPFPPQITEIIAKLKAEKESWEPRKWAIGNVNRVYHELIEAIPRAKARAEKAKIEAAKRKAEEEAAAALLRAKNQALCDRQKAEDEARKEAEFFHELEQKTEDQIEVAYEWGRKVTIRSPSMPIKNQMFWCNLVYGNNLNRELCELGVGVAEQCMVAFAVGLFEKRRELRVWESAIEADAPALPSPRRRPPSNRSRRIEPKPTKLAAARTETNGTVVLAACARPAAKRTRKPKGGK
jgi:hypothetical protein